MKSLSSLQRSSLILLGLLTILFRYPTTSSPIGSDGFFYLTQIDQIIGHGEIFWVTEFLAFYGLYPGTHPLGVLIFGALISQMTGISIPAYQLLHTFVFSLVGTFGFFVLSGEFSKNFQSRWFASFCFTLSPRFLLLSYWNLSIRFAFIAMLPFFIWILLRLVNHKYGRHPLRLLFLLTVFVFVLPSLHRMALLIPGIILAFALSILFTYWQENATNRERAGRQIFSFLFFSSFYIFTLQYKGITVYNPSSDLFEVYLFSGDGIISSILNLATYHLIAGSPLVFVSLLGLVFWFQEGRVPISFYFGLSYLTLSTYVISDHIYTPYFITFGILLFISVGFDFFRDNLEVHPKRLATLFCSLLLIMLSFSHVFFVYQMEAKSREDFYYTMNVSETSLSTSFWSDESLITSVFESNDKSRDRRIAAYSTHISFRDSISLSSGLVNTSDMEVERISVADMYLNASDNLWKWQNYSNHSSELYGKKTFSVVNLAMPSARGQSSISYAVSDYYYKYMSDFTYRIYSNSELAVFWSYNYRM